MNVLFGAFSNMQSVTESNVLLQRGRSKFLQSQFSLVISLECITFESYSMRVSAEASQNVSRQAKKIHRAP